MADNRTMAQMLQAPIEGYEDAIFDALDSAAGGNFLDKIPRECLSIIESKSKVRYSRSRVTDVRENANALPPSSSHSNSFDLQQIAASLEDKLDIRMNRFEKSLNDMKNPFITPTAPLKAVAENLYKKPSSSSSLPSNTIPNPKGEAKAITTRSGMSYKEPPILPPGVDQQEPIEEYSQEVLGFADVVSDEVSTPYYELIVSNSSQNLTPFNETLLNNDPEPPSNQKDYFPLVRKDLKVVEPKNQSSDDIPPEVELKELPSHLEHDDQSLTLKCGDKPSISYNNYQSLNKVDLIDATCEEYSQEVLGFANVVSDEVSTPYYEPIVSNSSQNLTPFNESDFLLMEEADAFIAIHDEPISPEFNATYYDPEGDILILEALLNNDPEPPSNQKDYFPSVRKDLKVVEPKNQSSDDIPPEVELKELPPHLEYAFLGDNEKWPVIIAKDLNVNKKTVLIDVLKSRKKAITWKLTDIRGIDPEFCSHKILLEEDFSPKVPLVSPIHCVPKKGGMTVIKNNENELVPTRLVTGWRVCIDYRKLNEATRKDHFPLPFMDQMLERLAGNEYYCFLDGFSGYFQIPIDLKDQEKTTFTCPYGTFAYKRMPFGLCNAPGTFQRCMMAIFHDMIKKRWRTYPDQIIRHCVADKEAIDILNACHSGPTGGHYRANYTANKVFNSVDYLSKSVEAKALPTNDARVVVKFLKSFFSRFGTPKAIISDRGTHFYNDHFARIMSKYEVTHRLSTAYHPQTSGQVEVTNHGLKRILEWTVGENRAVWSDKLEDALCAFRTAFKTS
nr:reverse transcriptase domain-containing protein [Tanacetum cinerariifolium]